MFAGLPSRSCDTDLSVHQSTAQSGGLLPNVNGKFDSHSSTTTTAADNYSSSNGPYTSFNSCTIQWASSAPSSNNTLSSILSGPNTSDLSKRRDLPNALSSVSNLRAALRCPVCDKVFSNSSAIAKHKLTHSEERKYVCSVCQKAFKRQDHLNGHRYTHESKKPHGCHFCEKSYSDARSLRRHYENSHSEEYDRWLLLSRATDGDANAIAMATAALLSSTTSTNSVPSTNSEHVLGSNQIGPTCDPANVVNSSTTSNSSLLNILNNQASVGGKLLSSQLLPPVSPGIDDKADKSWNHSILHSSSSIATLDSSRLSPFLAPYPHSNANSPSSGLLDPILGMMDQEPHSNDLFTACSTTASLTAAEVAAKMALMMAHPLEAPRRVACLVCQKRFKNQSALNGHMRLHGGYGVVRPNANLPSSGSDKDGKSETSSFIDEAKSVIKSKSSSSKSAHVASNPAISSSFDDTVAHQDDKTSNNRHKTGQLDLRSDYGRNGGHQWPCSPSNKVLSTRLSDTPPHPTSSLLVPSLPTTHQKMTNGASHTASYSTEVMNGLQWSSNTGSFGGGFNIIDAVQSNGPFNRQMHSLVDPFCGGEDGSKDSSVKLDPITESPEPRTAVSSYAHKCSTVRSSSYSGLMSLSDHLEHCTEPIQPPPPLRRQAIMRTIAHPISNVIPPPTVSHFPHTSATSSHAFLPFPSTTSHHQFAHSMSSSQYSPITPAPGDDVSTTTSFFFPSTMESSSAHLDHTHTPQLGAMTHNSAFAIKSSSMTSFLDDHISTVDMGKVKVEPPQLSRLQQISTTIPRVGHSSVQPDHLWSPSHPYYYLSEGSTASSYDSTTSRSSRYRQQPSNSHPHNRHHRFLENPVVGLATTEFSDSANLGNHSSPSSASVHKAPPYPITYDLYSSDRRSSAHPHYPYFASSHPVNTGSFYHSHSVPNSYLLQSVRSHNDADGDVTTMGDEPERTRHTSAPLVQPSAFPLKVSARSTNDSFSAHQQDHRPAPPGSMSDRPNVVSEFQQLQTVDEIKNDRSHMKGSFFDKQIAGCQVKHKSDTYSCPMQSTAEVTHGIDALQLNRPSLLITPVQITDPTPTTTVSQSLAATAAASSSSSAVFTDNNNTHDNPTTTAAVERFELADLTTGTTGSADDSDNSAVTRLSKSLAKDTLFRNPHAVPPPSKRLKRKPAPIFIPPQASANLSRLRSPRIWSPNAFGTITSSSPPPYTPPPMLSPNRRGSGLFSSLPRSSMSSAASPAVRRGLRFCPSATTLPMTYDYSESNKQMLLLPDSRTGGPCPSFSSHPCDDNALIGRSYTYGGGRHSTPKSAPVILSDFAAQEYFVGIHTNQDISLHTYGQPTNPCIFGYDEETMRRFAEADAIHHHQQQQTSLDIHPTDADHSQSVFPGISNMDLDETSRGVLAAAVSFENELAYSDDESEEGVPSSSIPCINIGNSFQAEIPECIADNLSPSAHYSTVDSRECLLWYPGYFSDRDPKNIESLQLLMKLACSPAVRNCGLNMEYAFHLLCKYKGNLEKTLHALLYETLVVYDYVYAETTAWTTDEITQFQNGLRIYGRDFHQIAKDLQSQGMEKTVKACVEFYYVWKRMNTPSDVKWYRDRARRQRLATRADAAAASESRPPPTIVATNNVQNAVKTHHDPPNSHSSSCFYNLRQKRTTGKPNNYSLESDAMCQPDDGENDAFNVAAMAPPFPDYQTNPKPF